MVAFWVLVFRKGLIVSLRRLLDWSGWSVGWDEKKEKGV